MKYALAGFAIVTFIGSAEAQTTTCGWQGSLWVCNQQSRGPTTQDYLNAMPNTTQQMKAGSDYVNSLYDSERQARAQQLRQQVGRLVAAGQCQEARATALKAGDFDLARQVDSMCQPH